MMTTHPLPRIPLNTLAIAFGLAGLAGVWSTAVQLLGVPAVVAEFFWLAVAVAWVWLIVAHLVRGARSSETIGSQLRHPAQGPIAALVPVTGMLLGAHLHTYWPVAGEALVIASIVVSALLAGWILAFWVGGTLKPESFHAGFLLPTVASGLVAAAAAENVGLHELAIGAFAVGMLFWLVIFPVLLARLAFLPALPDALVPTLAILLAPPAVGGIAWFALVGVGSDPVSLALLGLTVLLLLMQLALVPRYLKLPFSLGFWSFTFSFAAAARYGIEWLSVVAFPGWQVWAAVVVAAITALIVGIGIRSLVLVTAGRRGASRAEGELLRADDLVERA